MKLILFLSFLSSVNAFSEIPSDQDQAVLRDGRGRFYFGAVSLPLLQQDRFETKNFKIVLKKEDQVLLRDTDPESTDLNLKAENVLYHAEKAHDFFLNVLKSDEVALMEQVVVRLEISNGYDRRGHFTNDAYNPEYNNAVSINGKLANPVSSVTPWMREIWFRPKKEISEKALYDQLPNDPNREAVREARRSILPFEIDNSVRELTYALASTPFSETNLLSSFVRQGGTFLVLEGALQATRLLNQLTIPKMYYIDTAMVPEIIYHEYSHIALSDYLKPDTSTPVIEGMADYFAAAIGNDPMLAAKIKMFSTAMKKNGRKKQEFQIAFEGKDRSNADFVLSLLWGLRDEFGEEMTNRLVFESRKFLSTESSDIRSGLLGALFNACKTVCAPGFADPLRMHQYFQDRGL